MANIENLKASVEKAAEKVAKCKATIERHQKQLEKKLAAVAPHGVTLENMEEMRRASAGGVNHDLYWAICEVSGKQDDIKGATRKLADAERILKGWEEKLDAERSAEDFVNDNAPEVIKEFLNQWKSETRAWHIEAYPRYVADKAAYDEGVEQAEKAYVAENPRGRTWSDECRKFVKAWLKENDIKATFQLYPPLVRMMANYRNEEKRIAFLDEELEKERKAKMFDLIFRVTSIVGKITDAAALRINNKGNLDGVIVGEKSAARVETNGVAGYNIVCYHYRTNVWEIKDYKPEPTEEPLKLTGKPLPSESHEIALEVEKEIANEEKDGQMALTLNDARSGGAPGTVGGKFGEQMYLNF